MLFSCRRIIFASLFFLSCGLAVAQNNADNPSHYSPYLIIDTMRHRKPDLIMLAAHRGVHSLLTSGANNGTPENSLQAIQTAADAGIEVVEIDVRLTQDGVPILTHDSTWGRETNVGENFGKCCFNPFGDRAHPDLTVADGDPGAIGGGTDINGPQESAGINPNVSDWSNNSVQTANGGILLREAQHFQWSAWKEHPPTLQQALDFRKNIHGGFVYAIDVKDPDALLAAWKIVATSRDVKGNLDYKSVFFKIDITNFPFPSDFQRYFSAWGIVNRGNGNADDAYVNVMPVFQTSHIRPSQNGIYGYGSEAEVKKAIEAYLQYPLTTGIEINQKDPTGIFTGFSGLFPSNGQYLANFNLVPEQNVNWSDGQGYYDSAGYCCNVVSNFFFNGSPYGLPSDTSDHRSSFFLEIDDLNDGFITTDDVVDVRENLEPAGKRNISYFQDLNW